MDTLGAAASVGRAGQLRTRHRRRSLELVAAVITAAAEGSNLLVSSREPLGVAGEQVVGVDALDTSGEAVELFCERARSIEHGFAPTDADLDVIARICERLDGMPLAVELAAGRVRTMSLAQLADRLADRFRLLRSSARGAVVERHQTLRATVEWSYRLLNEDERVLFDRLSVFVGSFDLDAVEAVCGDNPLDALDVEDLLSALVDKSLVALVRRPEAVRYRLLETLREYGNERLVERGGREQLRDAHVAHFVERADMAREPSKARRVSRALSGFLPTGMTCGRRCCGRSNAATMNAALASSRPPRCSARSGSGLNWPTGLNG